MKNAAAQELDTELLNKLLHNQISLQFILNECERKDLRIAQADAEIAALRERATAHQAEKDILERATTSAEAEVKSTAGSLASLKQDYAELQERLEATVSVFEALIQSHRPYGLDRNRFRRKIMGISQRTPTTGPQAARHAVLLSDARKVLDPRA